MIQAMKKSGHEVIWSCDPMHGNTESTSNGFKTRRFENIRNELELSFKVHKSLGSHLGGVHLELTGENVTECLGGARELVEEDLLKAYKSQVDPRLNSWPLSGNSNACMEFLTPAGSTENPVEGCARSGGGHKDLLSQSGQDLWC